MNTGMLWFDNDPKTTLTTKIQKAMDYYQKKFGRVPDMCLVNPAMLEGQGKVEVGKLSIRPYQPVMLGHLWIGMADEK